MQGGEGGLAQRRGAATAQEPAALRPAKLHLEVPAAEEGWVDSGWTRARGCRGTQIGPRRVLLGTLPQPVFRQPDVTGHTRTERPDRLVGGGAPRTSVGRRPWARGVAGSFRRAPY